jgi:hypothetical protein
MRLHAFGVERDAIAIDWLVRAKVEGESEVAIAQEQGVSHEVVRKRVSRLVAFLRERAATLLAAFVLLVAGVWALTRRPAEMAGPREAVRFEPPAPDASELRRRAERACAAGAWQACVDDVEAAHDLDPAGETPETRKLRTEAWGHLRVIEAPKQREAPEKPVAP